MLRITVAKHAEGTTMILEGRVISAWVDALAECWRGLRASAPRPIRVTLDSVTFIDDGGKAQLRAMHADGAVFSATTVMMRALVEEIGGLSDAAHAARAPATTTH